MKNSLLVLEAFEGGGFELVDDEGKALLDEGRAGVLATATADDVKALAGTREGDVEQIEVVDGVLQVLVQIVFLVDGSHHLLLTVVDGGDG